MKIGLVGWRSGFLSLFMATFAVHSAMADVPAPTGSKSSAASAVMATMPLASGDVEANDVPEDVDGRLYSNEWTENAGPLNARPMQGVVLIFQ